MLKVKKNYNAFPLLFDTTIYLSFFMISLIAFALISTINSSAMIRHIALFFVGISAGSVVLRIITNTIARKTGRIYPVPTAWISLLYPDNIIQRKYNLIPATGISAYLYCLAFVWGALLAGVALANVIKI